jgi:hypothetical protein
MGDQKRIGKDKKKREHKRATKPADKYADKRKELREERRVDKRSENPVTVENWNTLFAEAVLLHHQGITGDKKATQQAHRLLESILKLVPENNLVRAYCGSATSLLGRDVPKPIEKLRYGKRGLILLDKAVAQESGNVEIRSLRAFVCNALPEKYFHRTRNAIEDFNYMVSRYEQDPSVLAKELYWKVLYDLGMACKRADRYRDAESAWEKLLSDTTDPKYKELLAEEGLSVPGLVARSDADLMSFEEEEMQEDIIELHHRALTGDKYSAKKAFDAFDKALQQHSANPLLKAYYADCLSLKAQHEAETHQMFAGAHQAIRIMDSAVNARPNNVQIRLLRAYNSYRLPEAFFYRTTSAIEDFEYLIQRYEDDPSVFSEGTYWQLLYDLGMAYHRIDMKEEANAAWEKLLTLNPESEYRARIPSKKNTVPDYAAFYSEAKRTLYKEGTRLHKLAIAGDKKAAQWAQDLWKRAYEADSKDPVAAAYYGSSLALRGRDSLEPERMFEGIFQGLTFINKAVELDPKNTEVRLIRAYLFNSLPKSFFHTDDQAIADFEYIITAYRKKKDGTVTKELYYQILYDLGMAYKRVGTSWKAQEVWQTLLNESSDLKYQELKERMYRP